MQAPLGKSIPIGAGDDEETAATSSGVVHEDGLIQISKKERIKIIPEDIKPGKRKETATIETLSEPPLKRLPTVAEYSGKSAVSLEQQTLPWVDVAPGPPSSSAPTNNNSRPSISAERLPPVHPHPHHPLESTADGTTQTGFSLPSVPRHERRRTADSLVLDALPLTPRNFEGYEEALAPLTQHSWPRHSRGLSDGSGGGGERSDVLGALNEDSRGRKGPEATWSRFNRDYAAWENYWGLEGEK